jgi:hypothetical protein
MPCYKDLHLKDYKYCKLIVIMTLIYHNLNKEPTQISNIMLLSNLQDEHVGYHVDIVKVPC